MRSNLVASSSTPTIDLTVAISPSLVAASVTNQRERLLLHLRPGPEQ